MKSTDPPSIAFQRALTEVTLEARTKNIRLQNTEFLRAPGEHVLAVELWFFYEFDTDVEAYKENGVDEWIERKFIEELTAAKTDFGPYELPEMTFRFDSVENVVKNYQGSYYLRFK